MNNQTRCCWFLQHACKPSNIHMGYSASMLAQDARAFFTHVEGQPSNIDAQEMLDVLLYLGTPLRPSAHHPDGIQSSVPYRVRGGKGWVDLAHSGKVKTATIRALIEAWRAEEAAA